MRLSRRRHGEAQSANSLRTHLALHLRELSEEEAIEQENKRGFLMREEVLEEEAEQAEGVEGAAGVGKGEALGEGASAGVAVDAPQGKVGEPDAAGGEQADEEQMERGDAEGEEEAQVKAEDNEEGGAQGADDEDMKVDAVLEEEEEEEEEGSSLPFSYTDYLSFLAASTLAILLNRHLY